METVQLENCPPEVKGWVKATIAQGKAQEGDPVTSNYVGSGNRAYYLNGAYLGTTWRS